MSVFIPIPKKGNAKECSNYHTIALISHASKVTLKILQARLQQYVKCQLPDVQAGFRKGRGTRDQIANICWIIEKAREFQKNIYWPTCWETCMQVKQQLELDMEKHTCSKSGKGYIKAVYCLFNLYAEYIMRNAGLEEAQAGIKIARWNINNLIYADATTFMA